MHTMMANKSIQFKAVFVADFTGNFKNEKKKKNH